MSWLSAALLVCSSGDPATVQAVVVAAEAHAVDPALALAVACIESGFRGANPMGVHGCYPAHRNGRNQAVCVALGVLSLRNRMRSCGGTEGCALRRYNNHPKHKVRYAKRVAAVAAVVRRNK